MSSGDGLVGIIQKVLYCNNPTLEPGAQKVLQAIIQFNKILSVAHNYLFFTSTNHKKDG